MILNEIFNQSREITTTLREPDTEMYDFTTSTGLAYSIFFSLNSSNNEWEISFGMQDDDGDIVDSGVTGTGAVEVFSTVIHCIREFDRRISPNAVSFSAVEPNRRALYQRIIRTSFPGWSVTNDGEFFHATRK